MSRLVSKRSRSAVAGVLAFTLLFVASGSGHGATPAGYAEYIVPFDEDIFVFVTDPVTSGTIGANATTRSVISITAWADGVKLYYDHWENGYIADFLNNPASADETYTMSKGETLNFISAAVPRPRTGADGNTYVGGAGDCPSQPAPKTPDARATLNFCYDGRDRVVTAGGASTMTRGGYVNSIGKVAAIGEEVYPLAPQLIKYTLPFGESTTRADYEVVAATIQATEDNTVLQIDFNADGTFDQFNSVNGYRTARTGCPGAGCTLVTSVTLNKGQTYVLDDDSDGAIDGVLPAGIVVLGSETLQVEYFYGETGSSYNTRAIAAFPRGFWTNEYYAPADGVATGTSNNDVLLYNPNANAVTINYQTASGSGTYTLNPLETAFHQAKSGSYLPAGSGLYVRGSCSPTPCSDAFWGTSDIDSNGQNYDWSYSLVPGYLTGNDIFLSWAPGNDPVLLPPATHSRANGVYLTPVQDNTTFFVDKNGDGVADTTLQVRINNTILTPVASGFRANRLQSVYVTDNDGDLTGAHIWATGPFAAAYGENDRLTDASNGLDLGYTVLPSPDDWMKLALTVEKSTNPVIVSTVAGVTTVTFTIAIDSHLFNIDAVSAVDRLPANWAYVNNSTTITYPNLTTLSGAAANPTVALPTLTWGSGLLGGMLPNQRILITFQAVTTAAFNNGDITQNTISVAGTRSVGGVTQTFRAEDFVFNLFLDGSVGMTLTKATGAADPVSPGDMIPYTVNVTNPGTTTSLTGLSLSDPIPAGTTYVAASGSITCERSNNVRDEFASAAYTNNNGSVNWSGAWTETDNLAGGAAAGLVRVAASQLLLSHRENVRDELGAVSYTNNNGNASWSAGWTETDNLGGGAAAGLVRVTGGQLLLSQTENVRDEFASVAYNNNGPNNTTNWASDWTESDPGGTAGASAGLVRVTAGALQFRFLGTSANVADTFSSVSYSNSTGSEGWTGPWVESAGLDGSPNGTPNQEIYVANNRLRFDRATGSTFAISRTATIPAGSDVTIEFLPTDQGFDGGEAIVAEYSTDGGSSFVAPPLGTYDGGTGGWNGVAQSFTLLAYPAASIVLRFRATGTWTANDDHADIDTVSITYSLPANAVGSQIQRTVNLAGAPNATLSFSYTAANLEAGDTIVVEASSNGGGTWGTVATIDGATGTGTNTYDLISPTNFASANTTIRLRVSSGLNATNETYTVDNVDITYTRPSFSAVQRGANLASATSATFSFAFTPANLEAGDAIVVEASSDGGGSWTPLETLNGPPIPGTRSYDLVSPTNFTSATTTIRIRLSGGFTVSNESFSIDNVDISYSRPPFSAIQRSANLTGATTATFGFSFTSANLVAGDIVVVEASSDGGGSWGILETLDGPVAGSRTYDLRTPTNYTSATTSVRFRLSTGFAALNKSFSVDNVDITYTAFSTLASGNPPSFLATSGGCVVTPGQTATLTFSVAAENPFPSGQSDIVNIVSANATEIPLTLTATARNIVVVPSSSSATVGDRVWLDGDGDGVVDLGEAGIPGVEVTLKDNFGTPLQVTTTDSSGRYTFVNVAAGNGYFVEVTGGLPSGLTQTTDARTDQRTNNFNLANGQVYDLADLGFRASTGTAAFGDLVWSDADADGIRDPGEPGMGGLTVILYQDTNSDGIGDVQLSTRITAADGTYLFSGVAANGILDYVVQINAGQAGLAGYTATTPTRYSFLNVPSGATFVNADFGFQASAPGTTFSIADRVWLDDGAGVGTANDGLQNGSEAGIPNVTVALLDNAGRIVASTTTLANGDFQFTGVPATVFNPTSGLFEPQSYTWRITDDARVLADAFGTTTPAQIGQYHMVGNLSSNLDFRSAPNFGYNYSRTIGDTVFNDSGAGGGTAGNGIQDGSEPGISGVVVQLYGSDGDGLYEPGAGDPLLATLTTDAFGHYLFSGLAAGQYWVNVGSGQAALTGLNYSSPPLPDDSGTAGEQRQLTLVGTASNLTIDFGYRAPPAASYSLSGRLWNDEDNDGVDDTEPGFAGVTLELLRDATVVGSTITNATGAYSFVGLPTGNYTVRITDLNGILAGYSTTFEKTEGGGAGSYNAQETVTGLASNITDLNFGFWLPKPTYATISRFRAYSLGGSTVVEWTTAGEVGTMGFDLYRGSSTRGELSFTRVNPRVLPGLIVAPRGGSYYVVDPGAIAGQTYTYRLVEHETGRLGPTSEVQHGPYAVTVARSAPADAGVQASELAGGYVKKRQEVSPEEAARGASSQAAMAASRADRIGKRSSNVLKLFVKARGLYELTVQQIADWSLTDVAQIQTHLAKNQLSLSSQGREVGYIPDVAGGRLTFFNPGHEDIYTDTNVVWLTIGKPGTQMPPSQTGKPTAPPSGNESFLRTVKAESNVFAIPGLGLYTAEQDFWIWDFMIAGTGTTCGSFGTKCYDVATPGRAVSAGGKAGGFVQAHLEVDLASGTDLAPDPDHHVVVQVNGNMVGQTSWNGISLKTLVADFDASLLVDGVNSVSVQAVNDYPADGGFFGVLYVDRIRLTYSSLYKADANEVTFRSDGATVQLRGFTTPNVKLVDITDPWKASSVAMTMSQLPTGDYGAVLKPLAGRTYVAAGAEGLRPVGVAWTDIPSSLRTSTTGADYVILAPGQVGSMGVSRLAGLRQAMGLKVAVVDLEDVMDEYNHGLFSPWAIRDFLSDARTRWQTPPRYVTFAGAGSYDCRNYRGFNDCLIPSPMVDTPYGLASSDTALAAPDDGGAPALAVGRIPVVTEAELLSYYSKLRAFETAAAGAGHSVIFVADNPDPLAGDFPTDSDDLAEKVPAGWGIQKAYLDYSIPGDPVTPVRQAIASSLSSGVGYFSYLGHGSVSQLADEGLFNLGDVSGLSNGQLPVVTFLTCAAANFGLPGFDSLGEALVLRGSGGAVAVWGPTGLSLNLSGKKLGEAFYGGLSDPNARFVGDLVLKAHQGLGPGVPFMHSIYNLLGDSAVRISPGK